MLIKAIGGAQVKKAIAARQKQVKVKLDTALAGGEHRRCGVCVSCHLLTIVSVNENMSSRASYLPISNCIQPYPECIQVWLDIAGYSWIQLDMAGYGWIWLDTGP